MPTTRREALQAAMAEHRYDVQAALYLLALHRLLRGRLGAGYDPARQLGGAVYFFIRGIHGPARGCHHVPPPLALLEALDDAAAAARRWLCHDRAPGAAARCRPGAEAGWLRRLDAAFARFVARALPRCAGAGACWLRRWWRTWKGAGHSCLPLDELLHDAGALLGWPAGGARRVAGADVGPAREP